MPTAILIRSYMTIKTESPKMSVYNGTTSFKYHYNVDGNLGKLIDNDNDIEWFYQYDLAGRLTSAASTITV